MLKQRSSVVCYVGLGSNLGDRESYLNQAVAQIKLLPETDFVRHSAWIETAPVGKTDQPYFLNGVVEIKTMLHPVVLLQQLKGIERKLGRVHREVWGPREVDLDILFYGDQLICEDQLTIPHPLLHARKFVLQPMLELAPDLIHPAMEQTIQTLFDKLL
jgi:2-amino-4-hydroxy-6-hydroxymethyldihydropteridine diphosphokinase